MYLACGSLLAAITVSFLKLKTDDRKADSEGEQPADLKGAATSG
jgi:hypothetical protein